MHIYVSAYLSTTTNSPHEPRAPPEGHVTREAAAKSSSVIFPASDRQPRQELPVFITGASLLMSPVWWAGKFVRWVKPGSPPCCNYSHLNITATIG